MDRFDRLLENALRNPAGLRFGERCQLAEYVGFEFNRQRGSHRIYRHPGLRITFSFQDSRGKAKANQVRQVLAIIAELGGSNG